MDDEKVYEICKDLCIEHNGHRLYRIRSLINRPRFDVLKGSLGGYIESENNLTDHGWVGDNAKVYGNAVVSDGSAVLGNAEVFDHAVVRGLSVVSGKARVYEHAKVKTNSLIGGDAKVHGNALVTGFAIVSGNADVTDYAIVSENARVYDNASVCEQAIVSGWAKIYDTVCVKGVANIRESVEIRGDAVIKQHTDYMVFHDTWSAFYTFVWTASNDKWSVWSQSRTAEDMIKQAYNFSEVCGKGFEATANYVNELKKIRG